MFAAAGLQSFVVNVAVVDSMKGALLLENAAGQRHAIGSSLNDLAILIEGVASDRIGACLDTAHLIGAGVEFRDHASLATLLTEFDASIGLERLELLHLNDSKKGLGSGRDLHQNIGYGTIGVEGFAPLLTSLVIQAIPAILEVPGIAGTGPDLANLRVAQSISAGDRPDIEPIVEDQLTLGI